MISKETFECNRYCGECCKKLIVRVTKGDIERIRKLGYEDEDFVDRDLVYRNRPKACEQYPFFAKNLVGSCLPKKMYPSAFVSFTGSKK